MPTTRKDHHSTGRRRWAIAVLLLLALFGLMAAGLTAGSPSETADADADRPSSAADVDDGDRAGDEGGDEEAEEAALEAAEEPVTFTPVDLVDGDADPGDPGEADFGDGPAADPCAQHDPSDGRLRVGPDPLVLPNGDMTGEIYVRNCGNDDVVWTAATKPSVSLATSGGTLDPGEVFPIELTIDGSQWEPGAIEFKVKVSEPGHSTYVDVQAFRPAVGADMVASDDLSAGEGVGGCGNQCITKAQLSTGYSSPDVGLDVATTVPAKVRVYLSKNAPSFDQDDNPYFPGALPKATSPNGVQSWKTTLADLQPTTKYFIIVKATDADGDTAYRHGSFKTITPVQQDGGFAMGGEEPGCANQCMTKATVTPGDGAGPAKVVVRSHTPAIFQIVLSTKAPTTKDGHPHLEQKDVWHTSGLDYIEAWDHEVNGLQPATTYHGIIIATDANGHRAYATGKFTTDGIDVVITIHEVHISGDGDDSWKNRGELSFAWGVGEDTVGIRDEEKMHSGSTFAFADDQSTYRVHDATGYLPVVNLTAFERDADGRVEFCAMGYGIRFEPGSSGDCDEKWNVATSSPVRAGDLARLPDCSDLGIEHDGGADGCLRIQTPDKGDDYASVWTVISYRYDD